jgi:pilus assembly protein Flp/PilA
MFDSIIRFMLTTTYGIRTAAQRRDETGAAAVEYGLLIALIAVAIVGAVALLGGFLSDLFDGVRTDLGG